MFILLHNRDVNLLCAFNAARYCTATFRYRGGRMKSTTKFILFPSLESPFESMSREHVPRPLHAPRHTKSVAKCNTSLAPHPNYAYPWHHCKDHPGREPRYPLRLIMAIMLTEHAHQLAIVLESRTLNLIGSRTKQRGSRAARQCWCHHAPCTMSHHHLSVSSWDTYIIFTGGPGVGW